MNKNLSLLWWKIKNKIDPSSFVVNVEPDVKMSLYFDDQFSRIIYFEEFEKEERQFLKDFLKPGDTFIDVGANIGLMTLIGAQAVGKTGRVIALEPVTKNYQRLLKNVLLNKFDNVVCVKKAVSDEIGKTKITTSIDGFGAWDSLAIPSGGSKFSTEDISTTTIDSLSIENVSLIKIDVEGWEMHVLRGGKKKLSRKDAPVLQVEFTDKNLLSAGTSSKDLYKKLQDLGYKMYRYNYKKKRLIHSPLRRRYPYCNLFAIKDIDTVNEKLKG